MLTFEVDTCSKPISWRLRHVMEYQEVDSDLDEEWGGPREKERDADRWEREKERWTDK